MPENSNKSATPIVLIFLSLVGVAVFIDKSPIITLWVYLAASIFTFFLYLKDKSSAKKGKWRTPEQTLHVYSFLCGWPGALLAQQWLRHKSQKRSFRTIFWITVVLNLAVLIWLHTTHARELINKFIK